MGSGGVEFVCVCARVCVPNRQQWILRAPKQNSLSPLESNSSVQLISKEWRDGGWRNFTYSEKYEQMSNGINGEEGRRRTERRSLRVNGVQEEVKCEHIVVKNCSIFKNARRVVQIQISSLR